MIRLSPLSVRCPQCGSADITYSCEPECCFNHVCGACYTTFELVTVALDACLSGTCDALPERDSCDPTVACGNCESLDVFMADPDDGTPACLVCTACRRVLKLDFIDIAPRT